MDEVSPPLLSKAAVRTQIDTTEANIGRLSSQIQSLASQIQNLTAERENERRSLARLWFMIAPVGTLPTELLTEIFGLSIQTAEAPSRPTHASTRPLAHPAFQQALHLSQICCLWRHIVLNSPSLWALCPVDAQLGRTRIDGLQMLLDRSAKLPISVSLTVPINGAKFTFPRVEDPSLLLTIMPTAARWKDLDIDSLCLGDLAQLDVPPGTFTGLESLRMPGYGCAKLDVFASSPRLRRLILWAPPRIPFAQHHLPWTQLTDLKFTNSSLTTCLSLFRQCTNLVSVAFTGKDDTQFEVEPFIAPLCLKTLSLDSSLEFGPAVGPFFTTLSTPTLQTLTLAFPGPEHPQPWPASRFSVFQSRAPNITHISLSKCPLRSPDLIHLLRLTPALTKLSLLRMPLCLDSWFLQAFSFDGVSTKRVVPQLCELD
ncbi:hypothetical protein C8R46DRAFT_1241027 [Mycena filopes]|nr:hypothetical protein C8R46DRAFT_1241027 [Mycena filopes]